MFRWSLALISLAGGLCCAGLAHAESESSALGSLADMSLEELLSLRLSSTNVMGVHHTHPKGEWAADITNRYVRWGSSPRGAQGMILAAKVKALRDGRYNLSYDDVASVAMPALRHRLILNFEGEAEGVKADDIVSEILEKTPRQVEEVTVKV